MVALFLIFSKFKIFFSNWLRALISRIKQDYLSSTSIVASLKCRLHISGEGCVLREPAAHGCSSDRNYVTQIQEITGGWVAREPSLAASLEWAVTSLPKTRWPCRVNGEETNYEPLGRVKLRVIMCMHHFLSIHCVSQVTTSRRGNALTFNEECRTGIEW